MMRTAEFYGMPSVGCLVTLFLVSESTRKVANIQVPIRSAGEMIALPHTYQEKVMSAVKAQGIVETDFRLMTKEEMDLVFSTGAGYA